MINETRSSENRCMLEGQHDKCASRYLQCLRKRSQSDTGSVTTVVFEYSGDLIDLISSH